MEVLCESLQVARMNEAIQGILFDMGGTLRMSVKPNPAEKASALRRIIDLLGTEMESGELETLLHERSRKYAAWARSTLNELNEQDLWVKWMLPDWPSEIIRPIAIQLNEAFRNSYSKRILFDETPDVIISLYRRGYRLGLVSNTTSSVEIPEVLRKLRLRGYFDVVLLSALEGKRKPSDYLLRSAAEIMDLSPSTCAYIGDQPSRDVAAARKAGFSSAVILKDPRNHPEPREEDTLYVPDSTIGNLKDLLEIFPPREPCQPARTYAASLSTMWAGNNFTSLADFFEFARRSGFCNVELNHKVTSAMLSEVDLAHAAVSSIHEPCPADISTDVLAKNDWLISSLDEEKRQEGVKAILRSIDLAHRWGIPAIVVHAGNVRAMDNSMERQLRKWIELGEQGAPEFTTLQAQMRAERRELSPRSLDSVRKSLEELLSHAAPFGIRLGLENRAHYREIPSPDELASLLDLAAPEQLGFVFDVGHAWHLGVLGFYSIDEWLDRFSARIIGTHLHDVIGLNDHFAAGLGEMRFAEIAARLPEGAFRTCEFLDSNTPQQVRAGLRFLHDQGCIKEY